MSSGHTQAIAVLLSLLLAAPVLASPESRGRSAIKASNAHETVAYLAQDADYDRRVRRMRAATADRQGPPYLCALCSPRTSPPIRWHERDEGLLRAAAAGGEETVLAALT